MTGNKKDLSQKEAPSLSSSTEESVSDLLAVADVRNEIANIGYGLAIIACILVAIVVCGLAVLAAADALVQIFYPDNLGFFEAQPLAIYGGRAVIALISLYFASRVGRVWREKLKPSIKGTDAQAGEDFEENRAKHDH